MDISYKRKVVNIFLLINLNICYGSQKNSLIETVLLSTHNIWYGKKESVLTFVTLLLLGVMSNVTPS